MIVITDDRPLMALAGGGGTWYLICRLAAATAAKAAVQITLERVDDGAAQWVAGAPAAGAIWRLFGVAAVSGAKDQYVPVVIYGPVDGVTLPAAVTKAGANTAIGWGGTRAAGLATVVAMAPGADTAVAEITDDKAGAENNRGLWLYGREYLSQTVLRATASVWAGASGLSQALRMDGYGRAWLKVDASAGLTAGKLTLCRRGRAAGGWKATYKAGALADAEVGAVMCYGVPPLTIAAKAGASGWLQVLGEVVVDLHASVNVAAAELGIRWQSGASTLAGAKVNHTGAFAATASGALRNRSVYLLGKIFNN